MNKYLSAIALLTVLIATACTEDTPFVPESDLVVVITANIPDDKFAQPQLLIRDYIIPAVTEATH